MSFRDPDEVLARGRDTSLVQLSFPKSRDKPTLYANPGMLKAWSKVLANCLEDAQTAKVPFMPSVSASIPLDDEDCTAWEEALKLMYPSRTVFKVTWDNAERLLLLADKYDMPGITGNANFPPPPPPLS